jgi:hypothetical protein
MQGYFNPDENVLAYANRFGRNWSEYGWDYKHLKSKLYNIVWAWLKRYLWPK